MTRIFTLGLALFCCMAVNAQYVKGVLLDPVEGNTVSGATVSLKNSTDSTNEYKTLSDTAGNFSFNNISTGSYILMASSIGFEFLQKSVAVTDSLPNVELGDVYLPKKTQTLEGVVVVASPPAVTQKGDTTQFSASQFKTNPDATVEDLIKKMPGITVDKSGTVTAQGEQVKKVTVDGKDFFGDDATMAIRNLPSDVVDKIQVYDRLSDQAQVTGFDDGNSVKALNIVTRSGVRNGQFGRIFAGYGTDSRYQAGGNVSFFKGDRRISLVGNFNNVNQQNFAQQDLLGVMSTGGGRGGGRGGGGNFMVGPSAGIAQTNAFGINYGDKWGKKVDVTGSYFFNNSNTTTESNSTTQTFLSSDTTRYSNSSSFSNSNNNNHRINMRLEYKIDSNNTLYIIPSISFQNNNSWRDNNTSAWNNLNDSIYNRRTNSNSHRNGYNIGNNIMFRHNFAKRGRTFMAGFQTGFSKNDGYSYTDVDYIFYNNGLGTHSTSNQYRVNPTNGSNYSGRLAYTEPLGKKGLLEVNYSPELRINKANQQTFLYDGTDYNTMDTLLSNKFENQIITNSAGVNYRLGQSRDNQFSVGIDFQNTQLNSDRTFPSVTEVNQNFRAWLPNLRWMKKVGTYSNMRIFYRARTDFPSINQLQDVVDNSDSTSVSSGNPYLKQSYTHFVSGRYSYTNTRTNRAFYANVFARSTNNYISNATYIPTSDSLLQQGITVLRGATFSKPVNLNGYRSFNSFLTYSEPLKFIKSTLNINAGFNYERRPGIINNRNSLTNAYAYSGGLGISSNISEYVDFNINYNLSYNNSTNNINLNQSNKYLNQSAGLQLNLLSKNGWFINNSVSYQNYSGLSAGFNQQYTLWNAAIGKKFLPKNAGELKLSVFDLLKQNQAISRSIADDGSITDANNNVLRQYFMLTFTYSLKNFGKANTSRSNSNGEGRRDWRDGGGPPPGGGFQGGGRPGF